MKIAAGLFALIALCGCFQEGVFAFLRSPPDEALLPGDYRLDQSMYSYVSLKKDGYSDLSGSLTIRSDGTFSLARIPDCCIYGEYGFFGGYFDGSGTWKVKKNSSVFDIEFHFVHTKRDGPVTVKQPQLFADVSFHLTKGKERYGLAAPLFDGEFRYAYFEKKANKTPEPTAPSGRGSS